MPLGKNADAGDYVKDFQKSDAPQFKGKSKKKRHKMAIAAFLDSRRKKREESVRENVNVYDAHTDAQNHSNGSMSVKKVQGKPSLIMKSYHSEKDGHAFAKKHGYKASNYVKTHAGSRMHLHKESVQEKVVDFDSPGMLFKVSVEGLPDMIMAGRGPSDIKARLRKIVKQPSMIQNVKRMPKTEVKKMFRDIFQGREEDE